ncbi:MAG TPA: Fe-S protein assembly co-chaperone HscB [Burkholderiales bacterium]|nr:Fe-S protein assembly co-chaperone HscB [Burkholderiales bacterium]
MNQSQTHFELFGLAAGFDIDLAALESRYRQLQREVHPDRFAAAPQAQQRVAMELATRVNEAYRTLRSPVERAKYLLKLNGVDAGLETDTAMPHDFLVQQMELREALEEAVEAENGEKLADLRDRLQGGRGALLLEIEAQLGAGDWNAAAGTLRRLMFMEKLGEEIAAAEDDL